MKRCLALTVAIACLIGGSAAASAQLAKGIELFDRAEFDAAERELAPLAKNGDAKAQYVLGVMYLNGMVQPPSKTAALEMMIRSGELGFDRAYVELARMYREGHGVDQDFAKSFFWSMKAANAGDVGAQLQVADSLAFGHGVKRDPGEAYKWYEIAIHYWGSLAANARDIVAESMSAEQIAESKRRADIWIKGRPEKN